MHKLRNFHPQKLLCILNEFIISTLHFIHIINMLLHLFSNFILNFVHLGLIYFTAQFLGIMKDHKTLYFLK